MVLCFSVHFLAISQVKLQGQVYDIETNLPLWRVNILIKNTKDSGLIAFTKTNELGAYSLMLPTGVDSVQVETSLLNYSSKLVSISVKQLSGFLNFKLERHATLLDEVLIEGEKKGVTIKQDTTVYNINRFKDGTERVVEDVLKKLPGITVAENGELKFKGKSVTRLLLDNDNIFDANYTIGTRNIDPKIIEEIQAIEDYNENPLLKDVISSKDVALNLVLKKGKTDFSGNLELGLGYKDKEKIKITPLAVSKTFKGFAVLSYNSIGENYSPYNFVSNILDMSTLNEAIQRTSNLVNNTGFNSNLPADKIRVNNNLFGSLNGLYRVNEKLSIRLNYNLFKDRLIREEQIQTTYGINNEELDVNNYEDVVKNPLVNAFTYKLIYNINKSSLLTSDGILDSKIVEKSSNGFNNNLEFNSDTKSKDLFLKNNTEYTCKLNAESVFQLTSNVSTNRLPQNVDVAYDINQFYQDIDFKTNYLRLESAFLSRGNRSEYEAKVGYTFAENFVNSELEGVQINNESSNNDIYYKNTNLFANLNYQLKFGKWRLETGLKINYYKIALNDINTTNYRNDIFNIQPELELFYAVNKKTNLSLNYKLSNQIPDVSHVYSGLILTTYRTLLRNNFNFNLFETHAGSVGFRVNDFFNLFQFNVFSDFRYSAYGYVSNLQVDEDFQVYNAVVAATDNKKLNVGLDLEKYIRFLKTTLNLRTTYGLSSYQNVINNSELRDNTAKSFMGEFSFRTGFRSSVNFSNVLMFNHNTYKTQASNIVTAFTSLENKFKMTYQKNDFNCSVSSQYFNSDLSNANTDDLFLNATFSYKPKQGKLEYILNANNLLNQDTFRNIYKSDFSSTIFEHNLQERYLLLTVRFKF